MQKKQLYVAGPLFTQAEWTWNAKLAAALRARYDVVLPQEASAHMLAGTEPFSPGALFQTNVASLERADVVIAILDGADVDSGTAWECGYAHKLRTPVIGLRTDLRRGGDDPGAGVNLMLSQGCRKLIVLPPARRDDFEWVVRQLTAAVDAVAPQAGQP